MRIFLLLMFAFASLSALAQEEVSLFPELGKLPSNKPAPVAVQQEELQTEEASENQDLFAEQPIVSEETPQEQPEQLETEEADEEDETQRIFVFIADPQGQLAPNRNASFCSANLGIINGLKKDITKFSGSFTIGSITKNFSFNKIVKKTAVGGNYTFVGSSCEQILNPPEMNYTACQIDGWSEKKCKSKIQFIPLQNSDNVVE